MNFDKEQTAVILTALRLMQEEMRTNFSRVLQFPELAEVKIDLDAIDLEYIDELCEEINCSQACVPASALRRLIHAVDYDIFTGAPEYKDRVKRAEAEIIRAWKLLRNEETKPLDLIQIIAGMTSDGESVDGNTYEMTADDAISTMNDLIKEARKLCARKRAIRKQA